MLSINPEVISNTHNLLRLQYGISRAEKAKRLLGTMSEYQQSVICKNLYTDIKFAVKEGKPIDFERSVEAGLLYDDPVSVEEFLEDPFYLGLKGQIYPRIMQYMQEINSGDYDEIVLTGAIGTAKTTQALWTTAYQLYKLSLYINPHAYFKIDTSSEILFVFQSISGTVAKVLDYARFRALLEASPYFTDIFPFDPNLESTLQFPRRIEVRPISGEQTGAIGQNVIGGIIDEINYMAKVEKSKKASDGGSYDQATALYNSIAKRRKSRFMSSDGSLPGLLCLVSSKRYPGQFTDVKEEEMLKDIDTTGSSRIYLYDKRTWEVLPEERFQGDWFKIFTGDITRKPRILEEGEDIFDLPSKLVMDVPEGYRKDFENDMMEALREVAGIATLAKHPYFINVEAVNGIFGKHQSCLSRTEIEFSTQELKIYPNRFFNPNTPRYVHIDLGITGDAAGVACGTTHAFKSIQRGQELTEVLPIVRFDFTLQISAPKNGEIEFHRIRSLIYKLRELGLNIKWVSLDSFQSRDTVQILRTQNFTTGTISVDSDTEAYDHFKAAVYDGRCETHEHGNARLEMISLEKDVEKNKVDHPPGGSKDITDAMAGVVRGVVRRMELWLMHGINPVNIPPSVRQIMVKEDTKLKTDNVNSRN